MSFEPVTPDTLGPQLQLHIEWVAEQAQEAEGQAELGELVEDLCEHYRALAICMFADDASSDDFFAWLLHSPIARRHYLTTVYAKGKGRPRDGRASFVDPVQDAIVARQWKLAGDLCAAASPTWLEGLEYEEDYCYGRFLAGTLAEAETGLILARWQSALEGGADPRLAVARAFHAKDAGEFEQALTSLLREREKAAAKMVNPRTPSLLTETFTFAPNRWVSMEGLSWLALAERTGLASDYHLPACPAALREAKYPAFRPQSYPNRPID
jgi:hypothetical protein